MRGEEAVDTAKGVIEGLVVVVSLVHTLMDSFGSASEIYRKLKHNDGDKDRSDSDEHKHLHQRPLRKRRDSSSDSSSRRHLRKRLARSRSRKRVHYNDSDEESIDSSRAVVRAEYDHGYNKLGEKFAVGDLLAQNQLQAQIISIQQIIIATYQDCFASPHTIQTPSTHHLSQLVQTTRAARAASTAALAELYQRLSPELDHHRHHIPGAFPLPLMGSSNELIIHKKESRGRSRDPDHRLEHSHGLFCPYARDLQQHIGQPLADSYAPGGDGGCPYCRIHLPIRPGKAWELILGGSEHHPRTFILGLRFFVKCHRESGGFACLFCNNRRDYDTVCKEVVELVDHIWREHDVSDVLGDEDIRELGRDER